jgi:hypothetical protein
MIATLSNTLGGTMTRYILAALLAIAPTGAALSQSLVSDDEREVERVVAVYIQPDLFARGAGLMFESRVPEESGKWSDRRDATQKAALAKILGAKRVAAESVLHCAGAPKKCDLDGPALVTITTPRIKGDTAFVRVQQHLRGLTSIGVATTDLILARAGKTWRVVGGSSSRSSTRS